MDNYRAFIEKFDEREKDWLVRLSKHSKVETNLKVMKQMNVRTERAGYVRLNIHRLDMHSRLEYDGVLRNYEWRQQYEYGPGALAGLTFFIFKLATKPPTKGLALDGVGACFIGLLGWVGCINLNNRIYSKHVNKYFKDIVATQIDNSKAKS